MATDLLSPTEDKQSESARRKVALALMMQGSSAEPIRHWTQGLARVAQGLMGGYELGQEERQKQAEEAGLQRTFQSLPGMSSDTSAELPNVASANVPASIRTNNPGAQWPGPSASAYGSTGYQNVAGKNKIAVFNSPEEGAAAQFDLLNRKYTNMPLYRAIQTWSGGNSSPQYVAAVSKASGIDPTAVLTPQLLASPQGLSLAKAMAQWEAGRPYPMSDEQWQTGQRLALAPSNPAVRSDVPPLGMGGQAPGNQEPTQLAQNGPVRTTPQLTPAQQAEVQGLLANPRTRAQGWQRYQEYMKPKEQWRPPTAEEQARGITAVNTLTGEPKTGPMSVNVSTEKKGQEHLATKAIDAYTEAQQASRESQRRIALYDRFEKAADAFRPGATAELRLNVQRLAKDLGIAEGKDVPEGELMQMIGRQLAIHAQPKGQGSVSNYERQLYAQSLPNLTQSPEGLKMAIGIQRDLEKFDMTVAQIWRDSARANGGIPNFLDVQDKIAALGSPLTESQMRAISSSQQQEGGAITSGTPAGASGKTKSGINWRIQQ